MTFGKRCCQGPPFRNESVMNYHPFSDGYIVLPLDSQLVMNHRMDHKMHHMMKNMMHQRCAGGSGTDKCADRCGRSVPNFDRQGGSQYGKATMDVLENEDYMKIVVDVPGRGQDYVVVYRENNSLVVEAAAGKKTEGLEDAKVLKNERQSEGFRRVFDLNSQYNADAIYNTLQDGVLTVVVPKVLPRQEQRESHQMEMGESSKQGDVQDGDPRTVRFATEPPEKAQGEDQLMQDTTNVAKNEDDAGKDQFEHVEPESK